MNEQRLQAYQTLLQYLFSCTDEIEIDRTLGENSELVDEGFIEFLNRYAEFLARQGDEYIAEWCENLAAELGRALERTGREPDRRDYLTFLQTVLQAEYESNGDPKAVYPILQRNLDKLDLTFARLLPEWARNVFARSSQEETEDIAGVIENLCMDICQFPLGNRSHNLEIAIAGYEVVLEVRTREDFPVDWAGTLNNLAIAYKNRIRGERAENLERAIEFYGQALEVRTREDFPVDHAMTLNNLANAYWDRIRGERAENLERAIESYQRALEVRTR
ncbi:tetratricopeptide repeat protein, partial [Pannus brasiliensis CCIBt3594]